ncbi:hypothetical protein GCM10009754_82660 [Amycolatopsis minnesotensis]|uniref:Uncharacterized protein n=1 Tax=Amycolatopsis minnesotensis TaxID=337894 RepID=A0ABN2SRY5_9PSEU
MVAALAAGCTGAGAQQPGPGSPQARFYRQVVKWDLCEEFLCARLTVPIGLAPPAGTSR